MKKRGLYLLTSFIFILIFSSSEILAIEPCHDFYTRGDSNNDGFLDMSDAIAIIFYLFQNGPAPACLEMGDVNGDSFVRISDAIYILNYLFKDGPAPVRPPVTGSTTTEVEFYGAGIDDAPELAFSGSENAKINNIPTVFEVIELTDENGKEIAENIFSSGDIIECKVDVYENGNLIGRTFEGSWPEGISFSKEPFKFLIGDGDGIIVEDIVHSYILEVSCMDLNGQEGRASLIVETQNENLPLEPNCREAIDVCCYSKSTDIHSTTPGATHYVCKKDCDARVEMQPDGSMKKICDGPSEAKCGNIGPLDVMADFSTLTNKQLPHQWGELGNVAACNNLDSDYVHPPIDDAACLDVSDDISPVLTGGNKAEERKIQLLSDEPTPSGSPCYVDSMTILRNLADYNEISEDVVLRKPFIPESKQGGLVPNVKLALAPDANNNKNIPLGIVEGWSNVKGANKIGYFNAYGFLVKATLEEGSKHENCAHKQLRKGSFFYTEIGPKGWVEVERIDKMGRENEKGIGAYMHQFDKIIKEDITNDRYLKSWEEVYEEIRSAEYPASWFDGKKWIDYPFLLRGLSDLLFKYCHYKSTLFCDDDYGKPQWTVNSDLLKYVPQKFKSSYPTSMIGACQIEPPKIMWWDLTGDYIPISYFNFKDLVSGKLPWPGFSKGLSSYIMIVQDSGPRTDDKRDANKNIIYAKGHQYRWLCELNNLIIKRNDNVDLTSTDPAKMRRVTTTPPSCTCKKQKRLPGGLYEDDTANGGLINC